MHLLHYLSVIKAFYCHLIVYIMHSYFCNNIVSEICIYDRLRGLCTGFILLANLIIKHNNYKVYALTLALPAVRTVTFPSHRYI